MSAFVLNSTAAAADESVNQSPLDMPAVCMDEDMDEALYALSYCDADTSSHTPAAATPRRSSAPRASAVAARAGWIAAHADDEEENSRATPTTQCRAQRFDERAPRIEVEFNGEWYGATIAKRVPTGARVRFDLSLIHI